VRHFTPEVEILTAAETAALKDELARSKAASGATPGPTTPAPVIELPPMPISTPIIVASPEPSEAAAAPLPAPSPTPDTSLVPIIGEAVIDAAAAPASSPPPTDVPLHAPFPATTQLETASDEDAAAFAAANPLELTPATSPQVDVATPAEPVLAAEPAATAEEPPAPAQLTSTATTSPSAPTPSIRDAALALLAYLRRPTANFGTKNNRSPEILRFERVARIRETGIMGPEVRDAARKVGVTFPSRRKNVTVEKTQADYQQLVAETASPAVVTEDAPTAGDAPAPAEPAAAPTPQAEIAPAVVALGGQPAPEAMAALGPHRCITIDAPAMDPIFEALRAVGASGADAVVERHFAQCHLGYLAHLDAESNLHWTAVSKETKDPTTGVTRVALGPAQILTTNLQWLYSRRLLLGPSASRLRKPPAKDTPLTPAVLATYKDLLCKPDQGALWIAVMTAVYGEFLDRFFDAHAVVERDEVKPRSELSEPQAAQAREVADYVNARRAKDPLLEAAGIMLRMYWGASSLPGMVRAIRSGHTDFSQGRYGRAVHRLYDEAVAPTVQGTA
jgi:hypothetical protein